MAFRHSGLVIDSGIRVSGLIRHLGFPIDPGQQVMQNAEEMPKPESPNQ
jgi:hypothetical protein